MTSLVRILVVENFEPLRRFVCSTLQKQPKYQVIGEVSDGAELQPDLILLDIGLPTLNGFEVARRIREHAPSSKILFLSEDRSADIAEGALRTGASGYVIKSNAARELLSAVGAVLQGKQFVSANDV
jgi:DNA-binding NarL/FixJ family response regulator